MIFMQPSPASLLLDEDLVFIGQVEDLVLVGELWDLGPGAADDVMLVLPSHGFHGGMVFCLERLLCQLQQVKAQLVWCLVGHVCFLCVGCVSQASYPIRTESLSCRPVCPNHTV